MRFMHRVTEVYCVFELITKVNTVTVNVTNLYNEKGHCFENAYINIKWQLSCVVPFRCIIIKFFVKWKYDNQ